MTTSLPARTRLPLPTPLTVGRAAPVSRPRPGASGTASWRVGPVLLGQLTRFCVVGVTSTVLQLGLYLLLRGELGALTANLLSMVLSTVANVEANRRWSFGLRGWRDAGRHHARSWAVFLLSLGMSSGALGLLGLTAPAAGRLAELVVLVAANTLSAIVRFALLRSWVFGRRVMPVRLG
jgi:putative flippase GtrA